MFDIYLKASGQIALDNALQAAGLLNETADKLAEGVALDRIGEIVRIVGGDPENPITETIEGYHANLRLLFEPTAEQVEALFPVTILPPGEPYRVWA